MASRQVSGSVLRDCDVRDGRSWVIGCAEGSRTVREKPVRAIACWNQRAETLEKGYRLSPLVIAHMQTERRLAGGKGSVIVGVERSRVAGGETC